MFDRVLQVPLKSTRFKTEKYWRFNLQSWSQYSGTLQYFSTDQIHHKSKRKLDIQYGKLGIQIASRVAEQLKTQKNLKFGWTHSQVPILPSRTQTLPVAVKKHAKTHTKLFFSCPVLLNYSIFGVAHRWGEGAKRLPSLKSVTPIIQ